VKLDIFFSICQTPVDGVTPTEQQMFRSFFDQLELADALGFGTAWVAETHLSCQVQKGNPGAVIPHFEGEIGLNTDILQLAHVAFARTKRINVGSAIRNILCNGGPLAHAEAVRTFLTLNAQTPHAARRLELGFASGRFPFSNTPYGIVPRTDLERAAWPVLKNKIFQEATEIFLRGIRGDKVASKDVTPKTLTRADFRTDQDWDKVRAAGGEATARADRIEIAPYWSFDPVGIVPFEAPLEHLGLTIGTHDPATQVLANTFLPCGVFNLSITPPAEIEATHDRMRTAYHPKGGAWRRDLMPRTALIFVNGDQRLSAKAQSAAAKDAAVKANRLYWQAMEGTLDPAKVEAAVGNALVGNPAEVVEQIRAKYHPEDRLMCWFDFNDHDNAAVKAAMRTFMDEVAPHLPGASSAVTR
jgi:alkanesulfonate monooxygenase SsuD/methylene tetrahydromethanopterin reductase-like flavin-dependent oxidoreductase (luciferase family)